MSASDSNTDATTVLAAASIEVVAELGRITLRGDELLGLAPGAVLAMGLGRTDVSLRVGGEVWADGEIVDIDGELGVRVTRVAQALSRSGRYARYCAAIWLTAAAAADQRGALVISVLTNGVQTSPSARKVERPPHGAFDLERRRRRRKGSRDRCATPRRSRPGSRGSRPRRGRSAASRRAAPTRRRGRCGRDRRRAGWRRRRRGRAVRRSRRRPGYSATRPGCLSASSRARSTISGSPRGTMMVATSKGARRSIPARIASAPPSRCSGPVVSSNVRGPSASEQRRAIARRHSALPASAAALKLAGSAGSLAGSFGGSSTAEANGDHRLVGRARRQPGIAFRRARGAGAGGDDGVARRDSRARPANATPIHRPAAAGRAAPPPAAPATARGGRSAARTAGPRPRWRTARRPPAHPSRS